MYNPVDTPHNEFTFQIGDSTKLKNGDSVIVISYPDYGNGDSVYSQECAITSHKQKYLEAEFFTVSGRIGHGMSGGPVLNSNHEIIGIIKGGIVDINDTGDDKTNTDQGFVPIHLVIEDIKSKKSVHLSMM